MKKLVALFALVVATQISFAQSVWNLDAAHSNVKFTIIYSGVAEMEGKFNTFDGRIVCTKDNFQNAVITFEVDAASIDTDNTMRDDHLRSDDFFNAEKFPKMTFVSTSFTEVQDNKYRLEGNLTIRDVTKRVVFDVTYGGTRIDARGNTRAGFVAKTTINRMDYNLKWNRMVETLPVVSHDVDIKVNVTFTKQSG